MHGIRTVRANMKFTAALIRWTSDSGCHFFYLSLLLYSILRARGVSDLFDGHHKIRIENSIKSKMQHTAHRMLYSFANWPPIVGFFSCQISNNSICAEKNHSLIYLWKPILHNALRSARVSHFWPRDKVVDFSFSYLLIIAHIFFVVVSSSLFFVFYE